MKILYKSLLALFSPILLFGCEQAQIPDSGLEVKIGVIAPLSGERAMSGNNSLKGLHLAKQLKSHLDSGDKITFIVKDDHSRPKKAVQALRYLVNKEKVSAILLLSDSDSAIAIGKIADKYKTPILATLATNPETTKHSQFVSQLAFNDDIQAMVAALYVRDELFIKTVAVFNNPKSAYSKYLAKEFSRNFKLLGGQVTDFINLDAAGSNDYREILAGVKTKQPELLYLPVNAKSALNISKELNGLGWAPVSLVTDGMLSNVIEQYKDELGLIDGMLATDFYSDDMDLTQYGEKVFKRIEKSDLEVTTHTLTGIEGYGLLITAINQCEAPYERTCINNNIRSKEGFNGISGRIRIDNNGRAEHTLFINTIEDGEMKIRVKVN